MGNGEPRPRMRPQPTPLTETKVGWYQILTKPQIQTTKTWDYYDRYEDMRGQERRE